MLDESDPQKSRCIRCETCDGFPCLVHAKADAQVIAIDPALEHPNVSLLTNAKVTRLLTSASGREVTGVAVERQGKEEIYSADVVVSSCGAINSAALLLRSATDRHPNGLANASGVVGRHYMGHVNSGLLTISKTPNATVFQKTLGVNDFYFGDDEFRYPMGHISFVGKLDAIALSAGAPAIVPGMTLDIMAKHSLDFWLTSEDLPDPNNRVTLDRHGNIVLSYTPNNGEGHKRLIKKLSICFSTSTCTRTWCRETCSSATASRSPASRIRTARFGLAGIRRHRRSTRIVRRTTWTISTSWMAASSPRAARSIPP